MSNIRAKFFKDGEFDRIEIKIIGDPCDVIKKVELEHIERFPVEWAHYQAGAANIDYGGTPLNEVPGLDPNLATSFKLRGVHNAEQLGALSDAAALGLGMGGITLRDTARLLLEARKNNPALAAVKSSVEAEPKRKGKQPKALDLREDAPKPDFPVTPIDLQSADYDLMPVEE